MWNQVKSNRVKRLSHERGQNKLLQGFEASHMENDPEEFQKVVIRAEIESLSRYLSIVG